MDAPIEVLKIYFFSPFSAFYKRICAQIHDFDDCVNVMTVQTSEENRIETTNDAASKSYTSEIESFRSLAGDSDADRFEAFINQINSGGGEESITLIVLSPDSDKSHRTVSFEFQMVIFVSLWNFLS